MDGVPGGEVNCVGFTGDEASCQALGGSGRGEGNLDAPHLGAHAPLGNRSKWFELF